MGEVRWDRFIAALYAVGYDYALSIEHEDRKFEGSEDLVKRGFLLARRPQTRRLAAAHLADAARQLPEAHFLLAEIYLDQGDSQIAAAELDRYQKAIQSRAKNQPHQALKKIMSEIMPAKRLLCPTTDTRR